MRIDLSGPQQFQQQVLMISPQQNLPLQPIKEFQHFHIFASTVKIVTTANQQMVLIILFEASPIQSLLQKAAITMDI
jgi:hypothetical protein